MKRTVLSDSWLDEGKIPDNLSNVDHFNKIWELHPTEHANVIIFGKSTPIPRWQRSYGRDYKFSGVISKGFPVTDEILPYLKWVNELGYGEFNEILLNWYENGEHYIGSHSDDEKQLKSGSPIVTITLCLPGQSRKFRIRKKSDKCVIKDVLTTNGLVLTMGGNFQKEFKHEIVKISGKAAKNAGSRISITFRQFLN